ncbi:MAG TPA: DNA mismatch repair protein MutS, partial [Polyangiaceae bacterium]|nr:DNA mismatch repair protein MutS [Polyangiaceae bacterium]
HARTLAKMHALSVRRGVHERQLKRITGSWHELRVPAAADAPANHPYASDIDLWGPGSLLQRIDVTQTREGELQLRAALSDRAEPTEIRARQAAVEELFELGQLREELETLGLLHQQRDEKIDHRPFMKLFGRPLVFQARSWLLPTMWSMVAVTWTLVVLASVDLAPSSLVWLCALVQAALLWSLREPVHASLNLVTARLGFAKAYEGLFQLIERQTFRSPALIALQRELKPEAADVPSASGQIARLTRYESFAQLRTQGPLYVVLNLLTLWDLFCLERIESFLRAAGPECERWFAAVGKLELLASLATLRHVDPRTSYPTLRAEGGALTARALAHPLLAAETRVANDLEILGPGHVLIVTGSNMAGKSTLLRALGLNVALALAGGPVCAEQLTLPLVRLRASMRIDDSLQRGASYFHAELSRLRTVVEELAHGPPVLFLLDELLRGTNARARHQGAHAVILHLLSRGAMGVVATHDIALSELAQELPDQARNVHFTDVFEGGEMLFDYKLREGVVKTSNALRLLKLAGIDVEVDDALTG